MYLLVLSLGLLAALPGTAHGQGCSQCRDTVSQTNPVVQSSYREAILVMIAAASTVSGAAFLVLRRFR